MEKKENWMEQIEGWKEEHPLRMKPKGDQMQAQDILETINEVFKEDDKIVVTDVGQHQMFSRSADWQSGQYGDCNFR